MGMQQSSDARRRWRAMLTTSVTAAAAFIAGCGEIITTDDPDNGPVIGGSPRPYGRIPGDAESLTSGNGKLRVRAPADGRVWVGNDDRRYEIVSTTVRRNKEIVVDVKGDQISVDGQVVYSENLESKDRHTVFFLASAGSWFNQDTYDGIPKRAERVAQGHGSVTFTAPYDGQVWIGNDKQRRRITECSVRGGDHVLIDVSHDQVKVNGRVVYHQNLESKHAHSIFFQ